jgi:four helix bundle protein
MHPFRRLSVWRKAHELTLRIYEATAGISERRFPGLTSQLRRSAASVPTNIVWGAGRDTAAQFAHDLEIALASARELDYLVLLAADLQAISPAEHVRLSARIDEVCRMLVALRKTVRSKPHGQPASRARTKRVRASPGDT